MCIQKEDIFFADLLKFLNEFMRYGGYPEVIKAERAAEKLMVLKNIVNTSIEKDIVKFLNLTDALRFKRVLTVLASTCSNIISYEETCRNSST